MNARSAPSMNSTAAITSSHFTAAIANPIRASTTARASSPRAADIRPMSTSCRLASNLPAGGAPALVLAATERPDDILSSLTI